MLCRFLLTENNLYIQPYVENGRRFLPPGGIIRVLHDDEETCGCIHSVAPGTEDSENLQESRSKTAETVAAATVEVADFTALLDGATPSAEQILRATELLQRIEGTSGELKQLTEALGKATSSLKSLKNPMKVKSATRSVSYVKTVLENATPELPYQAKLLGAIVSGK